LDPMVIMCYHPHWNEAPESRTLLEFTRFDPGLNALAARGSLFTYDLCTFRAKGDKRFDHSRDPIWAKNTTAEAAFSLLKEAGCKELITYGIGDGSSQRAAVFSGTYKKARSGPHTPYQDQVANLKRIAEEGAMTWHCL